MIWVRTQDKNALVECSDVRIGGRNDKYEIIANCKLLSGGDEDYEILGYYQTEKKATEVLNHIQRHIMWNNVIKLDFVRNIGNVSDKIDNKKDMSSILGNVFEMPEDTTTTIVGYKITTLQEQLFKHWKGFGLNTFEIATNYYDVKLDGMANYLMLRNDEFNNFKCGTTYNIDKILSSYEVVDNSEVYKYK